MQNTSALWKSIFAEEDHETECKLVVAEGTDNEITYGEDALVEMKTSIESFGGDELSCGNVVSAQIDVSILADTNDIPRSATLTPYVRLVSADGERESEWLMKGRFMVSTRDTDAETGVITIHGYDAILKTEQPLLKEEGEQLYDDNGKLLAWPIDDFEVVKLIAKKIGVYIDARTRAIITKKYKVQYTGYSSDDESNDAAYTLREILGYIGAMYAGNWIMSDDGELRLVQISALPAETNYLVEETGLPVTVGGDRMLV